MAFRARKLFGTFEKRPPGRMGTAARGIIQRLRISFFLTIEKSRSQRIENVTLSSKTTPAKADCLVVWNKAFEFCYFACILLDRIGMR